MSKTLIINGHSQLENSTANRLILGRLESAGLDLDVRHLAQLYPDYQVDVAAEQGALLAAERVVWLFPLHWYSVPAILKRWIDQVLTYGFAFGSSGDKLHGKELLLSITIGGPEDAYRQGGYSLFSLEELLRPLEQTAHLIGMPYAKPVLSYGMAYIPGLHEDLDGVKQRAEQHAQRLLAAIR
jgi:putative NADPH-quinone reductase